MSSNLIVNNIEVGAGATIYTAASNTLTFGTNGSEKVRISSGGEVGIGINNPEAYEANGNNLVVGDTTSHNGITILTGTDKDGRLGFADGTGAASYRGMIEYQHGTGTAEFMKIAVAGDERLRITSAGNIGVGNDASFPIFTDANDRNFIIGTGSDDTAIQIHSGTSKYGGVYFGDATSGGDRYVGYVEYKHNDNFLRFAAGGGERLRIFSTNSGNGGIAKFTTPTSGDMLNLQNSSASGQGLIFGVDTSASPGYTYWKNNTTASYGAAFIVGGQERLRITSGGKLLVGTTAAGSSGVDNLVIYRNGNGGITIRNNANQNGNLFFSRATSGTGEYEGYIQYQHAQDVMVFGTDHTERLRIASSGSVGINTTLTHAGGGNKMLNIAATSQSYSGTSDLMDGGGICFQPTDTHLSTGRSYPGIFWSGNTASLARARAGIVGVAAANNDATDLVFLTRYMADGSTMTSADEQMRIKSNGFVGIGTNNPVRKLHVEDDNAEIALYQSRRAAGSYVNYKVGANGASLGMLGSGAAILSGGADASDFGIRAAGDLCISSGGHLERLRIDSGGRLGLGVVPKSWHSNNKGVIQGNGGYSILGRSDNFLGIYQNFYYDASDAGKYIANGEASAYFQNDGAHKFYTAVSGSADASASLVERLRIKSIEIDTHNDVGLNVKGGSIHHSNDAVVYAEKSSDSDWVLVANAQTNNYGFYVRCGNNATHGISLYDHSNSAYRFRVSGSGSIYATNTSVQSISDQRLKENIVDANSQWDDIKALKFRNFKWKADSGYADGKTYLGLIAQEVEPISPGLVEIDAQTKEDIENNVPDPEYKNVKYSIVWMKAVKALQEAQARIETLEAKVAALESA